MPSISWSSWVSEVHFPHLTAGLAGWGASGAGLGDCMHMGPMVTTGEPGGGLWRCFWQHDNFKGTLRRLKSQIFFGGRARVGTDLILHYCMNYGQHMIQERERVANGCSVKDRHLSAVLPSLQNYPTHLHLNPSSGCHFIQHVRSADWL